MSEGLTMEKQSNILKRQYWTEEEKSLLIQLREEGLTNRQIMGRLGRTHSAIDSMCTKLGIILQSCKPWTTEEISLLKEFKTAGLTNQQIAVRLGRTLSAIYGMTFKLDISSGTNSSWTSDEMILLVKLCNEGLGYQEIADQLGKTRVAIKYRKSKLGLCKKRRKKTFSGDETYETLSLAYFRGIDASADRRNLEFCITPQDAYDRFVEQNGRCALSGCPIYLNPKHGNKRRQTASLDRIDSTKGYLPDNIQWVHKDINRLKTNLEEGRFKSMCLAVVKTMELDEFIYEDSWEAQQLSAKLAFDIT